MNDAFRCSLVISPEKYASKMARMSGVTTETTAPGRSLSKQPQQGQRVPGHQVLDDVTHVELVHLVAVMAYELGRIEVDVGGTSGLASTWSSPPCRPGHIRMTFTAPTRSC